MANTTGYLDKAGRILQKYVWFPFGIIIIYHLIMLIIWIQFSPKESGEYHYYTTLILGHFNYIVTMLTLGCIAAIYWYVGSAIKKNKTWAKVIGVLISILGLVAFPILTIIGIVVLYYLFRGWNDHNKVTMESHNVPIIHPIEPTNSQESSEDRSDSDNKSQEGGEYLKQPILSAPAKLGPVGVGGWLVFFCACLTILGPLFSLAQMVSSWEQAKPAFAQFPSLQTAVFFENFGTVLILLCGFVVGCSIWGGNRSGKRLAKQYLLVRLFGFIGIEIVALLLMQNLPDQVVSAAVGGVVMAIFKEGIFFLVWWLYFKISKRVRNTYDTSSDGNSVEVITNHQNSIHDHLSPRKELIVAFGSILIFIFIIIFGARSLGRQAAIDTDNTPRRSQDSIQAQSPSGNIAGIDRLKRMIQEKDRSIQAQKPVTKGRLLKIGMSKSEVLNLLGEPDRVSAYTLSSGTKGEMWFYWESHGDVTFKNDYVDEWSM